MSMDEEIEKEIREIIKSDKELKEKINAILNLPFTCTGNGVKEVEQALLELVPAAEEIENKYSFIRESLNSIATQNEFINMASTSPSLVRIHKRNKDSYIEALSNRLMDISNKQKENDENNTDFESEAKEPLSPMLDSEQRRYVELSHPEKTGKYTTIKGEEKNGDKIIPSQEATEKDITASQLGSFNAELTPILNREDNNSVGSNITQSNTPDYLMNRLAVNTILEQQQKYIDEEQKRINAEMKSIKDEEKKLLERQDSLSKLEAVHTSCNQDIRNLFTRFYAELEEILNRHRKTEQELLDQIAPGTPSTIPDAKEILNNENVFKR